MTADRSTPLAGSPRWAGRISGARWWTRPMSWFATIPSGGCEFHRLEKRIGRNKAYVAVARKLLVVVFHVLSKEEADRFAEPERVARSLFNHIYQRVGVSQPTRRCYSEGICPLPPGSLGIGDLIEEVPWGTTRSSCRPVRWWSEIGKLI